MKIAAKRQVSAWAEWFRRATAGIALLLVGATLQAAAPSLRDVLTPEEFERAGLSKLDAAELEFLSQRLLGGALVKAAPVARSEPARQHAGRAAEGSVASVPPAPAAAPVVGADSFGREKQLEAERVEQQEANREIQSRVTGKFTGWSGRTVFRLENGQVWQQVEPAVFSVNLTDPVVTIRRSRFGAFFLGVEGYGSQVKVKRIR